MIDIRHTVCEGVAFRYSTVPARDEIMNAAGAEMLDGSRSQSGDLIRCGTCGDVVDVPAFELAWDPRGNHAESVGSTPSPR